MFSQIFLKGKAFYNEDVNRLFRSLHVQSFIRKLHAFYPLLRLLPFYSYDCIFLPLMLNL